MRTRYKRSTDVSHRLATAQHAHPADRFAPEIVAFLMFSDAARLRRLMRNSLDGNDSLHQHLLLPLSVPQRISSQNAT